MAATKKRKLPAYPEKIGLVTSPRGAAVHDVFRTLRRRYPLAQVLFAGVPVEGAEAPNHIAQGIRCVVRAGAEVVLVVRGGGSYEDLMPYNDERLARLIAACPVPVVTGIGHEPDTTIADMVADLRASTPTAAAEAVSPALAELLEATQSQAKHLTQVMERRLERASHHLSLIAARPMFAHPEQLYASEAMHLDACFEDLCRHGSTLLDKANTQLASRGDTVVRLGPSLSDRQQHALETKQAALLQLGKSLNEGFGSTLALAAARLQDLSPLSVLGRGYSISRTAEGTILKSIAQVASADKISLTISDGVIQATVDEVQPLP